MGVSTDEGTMEEQEGGEDEWTMPLSPFTMRGSVRTTAVTGLPNRNTEAEGG